MPHYLTFGIRVPAALADFFSSIAFVRVAREPELDELSRTITNLSTVVKDLQVLRKDRVSPDQQALTPAEQTAKSERPKRKLSELDTSTDVSAKRRQADCSLSANSPFKIGSTSEDSTEQNLGNELSPIEQQVDSPSFGKMPLGIKNLLDKIAGQATGKKVSPIEQQINCPLFSKLPFEVRNMIFSYVLVSSNPIQSANELVGYDRVERRRRKKAGIPDISDVEPPDDIDSAILQTCRCAYEEGISILYGENTFVFTEINYMRFFENSSVSSRILAESAKSKHGRMGLIRKVTFEYKKHAAFEAPFAALYRDWSRFIVPEYSMNEYCNIHFPALEVFKMDCSKLGLPDEEIPIINMFITKIATFGKLKRLTVFGVTHKSTLQRMKQELVRDDGVFESTIVEIENSNTEEDSDSD